MYLRFLFFAYRVYLFLLRPIRMGVCLMMIKDEQVLLVRHTYKEGWFMPGGGLKRGETIEQAARREAREETGAELGGVKFIGIYTSFEENKTDHCSVFLCSDFKVTGKSDNEIAEARLFQLNNLPEDIVSGHRLRIEEYFQKKEAPKFGAW